MRDAGGEADDAAGAALAIFPAKGAPALVAGIDDAKFNMEYFLATFGVFDRRQGRRRSWAIGAALRIWEGDRMVTIVHMTSDGEDACGRAPPCIGTSTSMGGSSTIAYEVQPLKSESRPVRAITATPVTRKNGKWTDESLYNVMNAVSDDGMPLREAGKLFGVPTTSLRDHLYGKTKGRHRNIKPILKSHEEKKLVDYVFKM